MFIDDDGELTFNDENSDELCNSYYSYVMSGFLSLTLSVSVSLFVSLHV